ncbi:sialate O-acetylesterase [Paenibacillus roseipurpureus]|uniref:Sialate O-acetylesterase n=1 Tax=Paenibacillus roseopurpureus TaxID=2918901 RepID=A0AA96LVL2_9BACL|nr:sialate O-acetylesterase [Paenibacillus sp. MBLB1832]WNR46918.1 sialate O-acetylesterase [Paenibacillus sp. MBLB1832]
MMDLFLLIGQSNMAGRGALTKKDLSEASDERIQVLNQNGEWQAAQEPIHFDKPELVGVGPGLPFAKEVLQTTNISSIGLIPCAVGGTKIERWVSTGDLYLSAIDRCRLAMKEGQLRGILWAQGESDSTNLADAESYGMRFYSLLADIRKELMVPSVPFIASELGTFIEQDKYPYTGHINSALKSARYDFPCYEFVSSDGLQHGGDCLHYDAPSARSLGRRMAEAWLRIKEKQ